jgi:DNA-binding GntR family transcriptional regulator
MAKSRDNGIMKRTETERAYEVIKRGILRSEIAEGSFLSEVDVRKHYGIGRTPFREACNRLDHEQLLEVVPRRGYLVSKITLRSAREIFEVRMYVEGICAELAASRATSQDLEELEEIAKQSWSVSGVNIQEVTVKRNTLFHLCIARMSHNEELVRLVTGLLERMERLSYLELRTTPLSGTDLRSLHKPILQAIIEKDPVAAREAMAHDIAMGQLDILGARGWKQDPKIGHSPGA